jgi:hypothetical protein
MMMKNKIILSFILLISALPVYGQSGWTRKKNGLFVKLDYSLLSAKKYYTPLGNSLITNKFQQNTAQVYTEYGITDRLTFIGALPLIKVNRFKSTESVAGIGDLKLEAKYRLTNGSWPISISVAPELPTGRKNAFAKNIEDPTNTINLPTGDGELNVYTTLAASRSFGKWYASAFAAYNFRTKYEGKAFRDLYQAGVELGVNPIKNLYVNTKLRSQWSAGKSKHPDLGFVRGDATTYTLLSGEVYYKLTERLGVSATCLTGGDWIAPLSNIYVAPYFSIGVMYER